MLYVLILAMALTCVMCERNALGLGAKPNEDMAPLYHSRSWILNLYPWGRRKRSTVGDMERFKVTIKADPCTFNIYDVNGDSAITMDELVAIFGDGAATKKLAEALDKSGDGQVDEEEFEEDMHKYVEGC